MADLNIKIIPYDGRYEQAVRECALKAWQNTYKEIFPPEKIVELVSRYYSHEMNLQIQELISRNLAQYSLVVDAQGCILGFQSSTISHMTAELARIYVLPEMLGRGLGTALLMDAEDFFLRNGFHSYQVKVHKRNTLGQKFYEKKGFEVVGDDYHEHFILTKALSGRN